MDLPDPPLPDAACLFGERRSLATVSPYEFLRTYEYELLARQGPSCPSSELTRSGVGWATYLTYDPANGQVVEKTLLAPPVTLAVTVVIRPEAAKGPKEAAGDPVVAAVVEAWERNARIAGAALGDACAGEDVAQETILRALRLARDGAVEHVACPKAYAVGIRRHATLDAHRRRAVRSGPSLDELVARDPDAEVLGVPDPESPSDALERARDVRAAVEQLSLRRREALILVAVRGLKPHEAAALLGTTSAAVRNALMLGLRELRKALRRDGSA